MAKKKDLKKQIAQEVEEIETLGQESDEKAVKWVQEVEKRNMHEEDEKRAAEEWKLHDSRKRVFTYETALAQACQRRMVEYDEFVPKGFMWIARLSKKKKGGLEIWIRDPKDKFYCKAMIISHSPKFDLNWIDNTIVMGLDQMDELERRYSEEQNNTKKFEITVDGKKVYL